VTSKDMAVGREQVGRDINTVGTQEWKSRAVRREKNNR